MGAAGHEAQPADDVQEPLSTAVLDSEMKSPTTILSFSAAAATAEDTVPPAPEKRDEVECDHVRFKLNCKLEIGTLGLV